MVTWLLRESMFKCPIGCQRFIDFDDEKCYSLFVLKNGGKK